MKIKKFLKKAAEEDRESLINDKDIEFLASIGVDYNKKKDDTQKEPPASYYLSASVFNYKVLWGCIAGFLMVAIALTLILYYSLKPTPVINSPIHYFEDNFVKVDSDLQELNNDLILFSLAVDEDMYDLEVSKTYDSLSGDNLYYVLRFDQKEGLKKFFTFNIVVNGEYEHEQVEYSNEPDVYQISGYDLKFVENAKEVKDTPFSMVTCQGEIQIGEQWLYIENYEEMALGQSTFIETLQSIISLN